jgi:ABC-type Mn2+/Zn2+ transport system ATPase subunit
MDMHQGARKLLNLAKINVLLGKNGSGKSTLLREYEQNKQNLPNLGIARYITPERGGELSYIGQLETNESNQPGWGDVVRRSNRFDNFRQLSVAEFRRLETLVLRQRHSPRYDLLVRNHSAINK